jgi:hypothetical protein
LSGEVLLSITIPDGPLLLQPPVFFVDGVQYEKRGSTPAVDAAATHDPIPVDI